MALPPEIRILPAQARVPEATRSGIRASSLLVAASSSERLRARSIASAGLRQAINRSPGVVGVGDLGQVLGVEQAHLQRAVLGGEFGDRWFAQRGDPPEIGCSVCVL